MRSDSGISQVRGSDEGIEALARKALADLWRYQQERGDPVSADSFFPVNVEMYVRGVLGWQLDPVSMIAVTGGCRSDVHGRCDHRTQTISLSVDQIKTDAHRRFTVAHEIGHALMHPGEVPRDRRWQHRGPHSTPSIGRPKAEVDADAFAEEMLMPRKTVYAEFVRRFSVEQYQVRSTKLRDFLRIGPFEHPSKKVVADRLATYRSEQVPRSLAEFFGVSREAMSFRLTGLKLLI